MIYFAHAYPYYDPDDFRERVFHYFREFLTIIGYLHIRLLFFKVVMRPVYRLSLHGKINRDGHDWAYVLYNTELRQSLIEEWKKQVLQEGAVHNFRIEKEIRETVQERFIVARNRFCESIMKKFCGILFYKWHVMEE